MGCSVSMIESTPSRHSIFRPCLLDRYHVVLIQRRKKIINILTSSSNDPLFTDSTCIMPAFPPFLPPFYVTSEINIKKMLCFYPPLSFLLPGNLHGVKLSSIFLCSLSARLDSQIILPLFYTVFHTYFCSASLGTHFFSFLLSVVSTSFSVTRWNGQCHSHSCHAPPGRTLRHPLRYSGVSLYI